MYIQLILEGLIINKLPQPTSSSGPSSSNSGVKLESGGKYRYQVTPADLTKEQQAFQPGEGVNCSHTCMCI